MLIGNQLSCLLNLGSIIILENFDYCIHIVAVILCNCMEKISHFYIDFRWQELWDEQSCYPPYFIS